MNRPIAMIASAVWIVVVGVGLRTLWNYETSPGLTGGPPVRWPKESTIPRDSNRATLIMLAHPHCPCSRASLGELAVLMARCPGRVTAHVLFFKPTDFPDGWERTDLWHDAAAIPGVAVGRDDGGLDARRFGAATSGQTLLYDAGGRLRFRGGITAARGHVGNNAGREALVSFLTQGGAEPLETAVFGCPLLEANSGCAEGTEACRR